MPDKLVERAGGPYYKILSYLSYTPMIELPVEVAGIRFPNPIGIPAGWIDTPSKLSTIHRLGVGIPTIKTITIEPKQGNPYPRLVRQGRSLINSLGLPNHGLEWWQENFDPPNYPVIISIKGETMHDWELLVNGLEKKASILELNISCPNIGEGVLDLKQSREIINNIASITAHTEIFLKLSPEFSPKQNVNLINSVRDVISGVTAINTRPVSHQSLGNPSKRGGLSGPLIYSDLLAQLQEIRQQYQDFSTLPVLATGGINSTQVAWSILSDFQALPMGLTAFLTEGPRFYYHLAKYVKDALGPERDLNSVLS